MPHSRLEYQRAWHQAHPEKAREYYLRAREKKIEYYEATRERQLANNREWHKANCDKVAERKRKERAADPDKVRAQARARYRANSEKYRAQRAAWVKDNPEKVAASHRARDFRLPRKKRDADTITYISTLYADPCCYCGNPADAIDHIEPALVGGEDRWENMTSACRPCNSSKGAKPLLEWLALR